MTIRFESKTNQYLELSVNDDGDLCFDITDFENPHLCFEAILESKEIHHLTRMISYLMLNGGGD
jgi:hypothetical protein